MRLYGEDNNNSNKGLLVANTRLGYVKLKFFTTKIFCNSPKLFERRIFPEYPPPALRDWGATPAILWG